MYTSSGNETGHLTESSESEDEEIDNARRELLNGSLSVVKPAPATTTTTTENPDHSV